MATRAEPHEPTAVEPPKARVLQRDRYLAGVVEMQARLLATKSDALGALNDALAPLGEASGASRVYVFENDREGGRPNGLTSQRAEWCAPGITPEIDNPELQGIDLRGAFPKWWNRFEAGQRVELVASEYDELEAEYLGPQGILSLLAIPLMVEGELTGFIGFDNCSAEAPWSPMEVQLLTAAASQIGLNLDQRRARRDLLELNATLEERVTRRTEALAAKNTELTEALSSLKLAQQQLIQVEKLSGLGRMVAGVAHELRNPANYIGNNLALSVDRLGELRSTLLDLLDPSDPEGAEVVAWLEERFEGLTRMLHHGVEGVERVREIVDSLVNFARLDEADKKRFTLEDCLVRTLRVLQPKWSHAEAVTVEGDTEVELYGYPLRLSQLFMNLIDNGLDAATELRGAEAARVSVVARRVGDGIEVRIRDNGPGVAPEVREHLFDPFVTTKPVGKGTGMGLSISWSVAEELGGRLYLAEGPGPGAEFVLEAPLASEEAV